MTRRLSGFATKKGPTLTERHRELLDRAMRRYLDDDTGDAVGNRYAVRAYATVVALNEGGFYPDVKTSIKRAERMSLDRLNGKTEKHSCGGILLVNRMCYNGHDPTKAMR